MNTTTTTKAAMSAKNDQAELADAMPTITAPDAPVDAWTLDELDRFGELHSLRSTWTGADDSDN
jgi:hypothetical protein